MDTTFIILENRFTLSLFFCTHFSKTEIEKNDKMEENEWKKL